MGEHDGHRDRMRRRFLQQGLSGFDDHNVLELLLFYAVPRKDTNLLAHRLIDTFGGLDAVFEASPEALMQVEGIGESAAVLIHLVPEAFRRASMAGTRPGRSVCSTPEAAARFLIPQFLNRSGESLLLVCLDPKNRVLDCRALSSGGPLSVAVGVRQIVETAILHNAAAVILSHNHPGGYARPSEEDIGTTLQVRDALAPLGIALHDHIIVAGDEYFSMADEGMLS